jgi:hypothetical protein
MFLSVSLKAGIYRRAGEKKNDDDARGRWRKIGSIHKKGMGR